MAVALLACVAALQPDSRSEPRSLDHRLGTTFLEHSSGSTRAPTLSELSVPTIPGGYAIWGAIGRDDSGTAWVGLSSEGVEIPSAHLLELNPTTLSLTNRGGVVDQLQALRLARSGEGQMKIHSKIVQANDGLLYFASMDEQGERTSPLTYPTWGGHLWRMDLHTYAWEHLLSTKEALIALGGTGRYVYALGYFGHVLYQYDTQTGESRHIGVGSLGAHISRNFLVDGNEHVYVPSVENSGTDSPDVFLVQLDTELAEVHRFPLNHYPVDSSFETHGLVGFTYLSTGSIVFASASGFLWRLDPAAKGSATVTELGWFHPDGESYPASLFALQGSRSVSGVANRGREGYQCVHFDFETSHATVLPFDATSRALLNRPNLALYGTNTRDELGNAYLGGPLHRGWRQAARPVAGQVRTVAANIWQGYLRLEPA